MNKQEGSYEKELSVSRIGTDFEQFTPGYAVLSVSLEFLRDGSEQVLSLQREFGEQAEAPGEICIVFSPSQQCAYDPLTKLVLDRNSLGMRFTETAAQTFGMASLQFAFSATDEIFDKFRDSLASLCEGESFFVYEGIAAKPRS